MSAFGDFGDNFRKRPPTNIQWLLDDETKKDYYHDLGIIGEISPLIEKEESLLKLNHPQIKKDNTCLNGSICETSSKILIPDIRMLRRQERNNRKLNRSATKVAKRPFRGNQSLKRSLLNIGVNHTSELPCEVLMNIFSYCDTKTKILCSRVCWRWYDIASDASLWRQATLARKRIPFKTIERFLERKVRVLCLSNTTIVKGPPAMNPLNHGYDPISSYQIHSLDMTNAIISSTHLSHILSRCNQLKNLSLEGLLVNPDALRSLSACSSLLCLNLSLCYGLTVSGLAAVLKQNTNLEELNLAWSNISDLCPNEIIEYLPGSLRKLNFSGFRTTLFDQHVLKIGMRCPNLQEIDISDSSMITSVTIEHIIETLGSTIEQVNLSRCYSVIPNRYLNFGPLQQMRHLNVFGIMDDDSIALLSSALPRIEVCLQPFTSIARPAPSPMYGRNSHTIWKYPVM